MKRATITIPDDLNSAVEKYIDAHDAPPSLTAVVQAALRYYLSEKGYTRKDRKVLRIGPTKRGSRSTGTPNIQGQLERQLIAGLNSGKPITADESYWERKRTAIQRRNEKKAVSG
jgi:Arc/MetJ-type ribon-helix-helix transcriptional regulator